MWIFIVIIVAIVLIAVFLYNALIRSRNQVDEAWSDIEVQLKRRYEKLEQQRELSLFAQNVRPIQMTGENA